MNACRYWILLPACMLLLAGCGSDSPESLGTDLERMHYTDHKLDELGVPQNPQPRYVNEETDESEDISVYSHQFSDFLQTYYEDLNRLFGDLNQNDFSTAVTDTARLQSLTESMVELETPPEYYDVHDLVISSSVELEALQFYLERCLNNNNEKTCAQAKIHAENANEYLKTMERLYERKLVDFEGTS